MKVRELHSRQKLFIAFSCAQISQSGLFSLNPILEVIDLPILIRTWDRRLSCAVTLNAEESSMRTCPLPACSIIITSTAIGISVPYSSPNPESLKIELLFIPLAAITGKIRDKILQK